jgi:hypothetical protein
VCKQGLLVDPAKIVVIVNLPPPRSGCQLQSTLGHIGYYRKFITGYAKIIVSMEKSSFIDTYWYYHLSVPIGIIVYGSHERFHLMPHACERSILVLSEDIFTL